MVERGFDLLLVFDEQRPGNVVTDALCRVLKT
jgi:hypothetical protein